MESYYKDADAIILVCDVQNSLSLQQIADYWLHEVRRHVRKECEVFLLANKADEARQHLKREDRDWCERERLRCYEVSAKTGEAVRGAIDEIASILKRIKPREENNKIVMSLNEFTPELKKKSCC